MKTLDSHIILLGYSYTGASGLLCTATATMRINGLEQTGGGTGKGPVEALFRAIDNKTGMQAVLEEYQILGLTKGIDAEGQVNLALRANGHKALGIGRGYDIVAASGEAYIAALNLILDLLSYETSSPAD